LASIWSEIWNGLLKGLNYILQAFYHLGGYGVAIILLTIVVKIVLLPLTWKQTRSMLALQRLQPEMKKLQEKYKNDKEKLGQEMMKFYKENKVNPLSGCLPLLLQLPVFIALYEVLRKYVITPPIMLVGNVFTSGTPISKAIGSGANTSYFFSKTGFIWVKNLSDSTISADPFWILIILMALTTWYSQKQVMSDPRQQKMMLVMPFLMAFIAIRLPAGVVLYWIVTNTLQIAQQSVISRVDRKHLAAEAVGKPGAAAKAPPAGKGGKLAPGKPDSGKSGGAAAQGRQKTGGKGSAQTQPKGGAQPKAGAKGKSGGGAMVKSGSAGGKPKPQGTGSTDVRKPKPKPAGTSQTGKGASAGRPSKPGGSKKKGKGR
jgi:YidC/Oxa1 family membrane protein insertase